MAVDLSRVALERTISDAIKRRISSAHHRCKTIVRHYPPYQTGEPEEVLFLGNPHHDYGEPRPFTARLEPGADGEVLVTEGW